MPKKAGMEAWKEKNDARSIWKKGNFRYYIFCEGQQTEPLYFEGFKRYIEEKSDLPGYGADRNRTLSGRNHACDRNGRKICEKRTKSRRGRYGGVYDKDSFPPEDFNGVEQRARQLSQENPDLAVSRSVE